MNTPEDLELEETREIARQLSTALGETLPIDFVPEHVQKLVQKLQPESEGKQSKLVLALQITGSRLAALGDGLSPVARELVLALDAVAEWEREGTEVHDRLSAALWAASQVPYNGSYGPGTPPVVEIREHLEAFIESRNHYLSMLWAFPRHLRKKGVPTHHHGLPPDQAPLKSRLTSILDKETFSDPVVRDLTEPFAKPGQEKRRALNTVKGRRNWSPKHRSPNSFTVPDNPEAVAAAEQALKQELKGKPTKREMASTEGNS